MAGEMAHRTLRDWQAVQWRPSWLTDGSRGGSFLSAVIKPVYDIIAKEAHNAHDSSSRPSINGNRPHTAWRNYDDMNEFFWTRDCFKLGWPWSTEANYFVPLLRHKLTQQEAQAAIEAGEVQQVCKKVAWGQHGYKTALEKRSWLMLIRAFDRFVAFLIISFQGLMIVALSRNNRVPAQPKDLDGNDVISADENNQWAATSERKDYIWRPHMARTLGTCVLTYAILNAFQAVIDIYANLQIIPRFIQTWRGWLRLFNLLLHATWHAGWSFVLIWFYIIFFAFGRSREYVARTMGEPFGVVLKYTIFWLVLLACKLTTSYYLQIQPLTLPTRQVWGFCALSYSWIETRADCINLAMVLSMWLPTGLVFILDTFIWYTVFATVVGAAIGLSWRMGEIHSFSDLRDRFEALPKTFCDAFLPEKMLLANRVRPSDELLSDSKNADSKDHMDALLCSRVLGQVWNEFVDSMREEDLLSNTEAFALRFPLSSVGKLTTVQWPVFLLAGQFQRGMDLASKHSYRPWDKQNIGDGQPNYMKAALLEVFECTFNLLDAVILPGSPESLYVRAIRDTISNSATKWNKMVGTFQLYNLPKLQSKLVAFVANLMKAPIVAPEDLFVPTSSEGQHGSTTPQSAFRASLIRSIMDLFETFLRHILTSEARAALQESGDLPQALSDGNVSGRLNLLFAGESPSPVVNWPPWAPAISCDLVVAEATRLQSIITSRSQKELEPRNPDAKRRLMFFVNSVFMDMPGTVPADRMLPLSILTPYYNEIVIYSKAELHKENEDGVSTIYYLQTVFPDDWDNFLERMGKKEEELWALDEAFEIRLWASYRGQTLARTVRGMMYHQRAIQLAAFLDMQVTDQELAAGFRGMQRHSGSVGAGPAATPPVTSPTGSARTSLAVRDGPVMGPVAAGPHSNGAAAAAGAGPAAAVAVSGDVEDADGPLRAAAVSMMAARVLAREEAERSIAAKWARIVAISRQKFLYVVTAQIYGVQKATKDQRATDVLNLLKRYDMLRVAYIDEVMVAKRPAQGREGDSATPPAAERKLKPPPMVKVYESVLVKWRNGREEEVYRVRLPGPPKLGEGKPENQNHAIIFTRGYGVQTIDMNQDHYLEECFKVRNLMEEFKKGERRPGGGGRKRYPTLLGIREHVFTGSISSVANFMSMQETSFVTIGQRTLAALRVRMHYGHPDIFDRVWTVTRGGVSKASHSINLSEDIYGGYNHTARGGRVTHHEYIQCGKGRDVGLNQIAMFEAKISSGNGEQILSRDVVRLSRNMDFFRMLSFYHTSVGFFIANMLTVLGMYAYLYTKLYQTLSGALDDEDIRQYAPEVDKSLNGVWLIQIGMLTSVPMIINLSMEYGFKAALAMLGQMHLQLSPIFFILGIATKAHYFMRIGTHGGAMYLGTGRGFVMQHEPFASNYRFYSRSHFVKAFEFMLLLIVMVKYNHRQTLEEYSATTFSMWLLVFAWLMGPFIFNPSGFDWQKTVEDWEDFRRWVFLPGGYGMKPSESWEAWWESQQDHMWFTGLKGRAVEFLIALRWFFFHYGISYSLSWNRTQGSIRVYIISWIAIGVIIGVLILNRIMANMMGVRFRPLYRVLKFLFFISGLGALVALLITNQIRWGDIGSVVFSFITTTWGGIQLGIILRPILEHVCPPAWSFTVELARYFDLGMGVALFVPITILAWFPFVSEFQTRALFNQAFSRGLEVSKLLTGRRRPKDKKA
eukprot:jgi/Mesvir1/14150/Mv21726-RA.2